MKKQKKILVANWKMNPTTLKDVQTIINGTKVKARLFKKIQVVVCAPSLYTQALAGKIKKGNVSIGVQNISIELKGSYTGEISAPMLADLKVTYAIIGHSERRKMGETDEMVNKKVLNALKYKITPIICVGETTRDEEGFYLATIKDQLAEALKGVSRADVEKVMIAYEPVWAIGASAAMDPHDVHQMSIFIKKALIDIYKNKTMIPVPLLYGGSVEPANAQALMKEGEVDGLLVGRQSLDPQSFGEIMRSANSL
jgi:triosephosphate isomerase